MRPASPLAPSRLSTSRPRGRAILAAAFGLVLLSGPAWWLRDHGLRRSDRISVVPDIPLPAEALAGEVRSVGSDALGDLIQRFADRFRDLHGGVRVRRESKGSSTAPSALSEGIADLGPMVREMKPPEIAAFEARFGYRPTAVRVAFEAIAIYVHRDDPLPQMTLAQADAIFSSTRERGAVSDITTWGQLGLTGEWHREPVVTYGLHSASPTFGWFKQRVLAHGGFKEDVREQPGSGSVVSSVRSNLRGCGYGGVTYQSAGVRAVPIVADDGRPVEPTDADVRSLRYPISWPLLIHVNRTPGAPFPPVVREFLLFTLSPNGQRCVASEGFVTLSDELLEAERAKVNGA